MLYGSSKSSGIRLQFSQRPPNIATYFLSFSSFSTLLIPTQFPIEIDLIYFTWDFVPYLDFSLFSNRNPNCGCYGSCWTTTAKDSPHSHWVKRLKVNSQGIRYWYWFEQCNRVVAWSWHGWLARMERMKRSLGGWDTIAPMRSIAKCSIIVAYCTVCVAFHLHPAVQFRIMIYCRPLLSLSSLLSNYRA